MGLKLITPPATTPVTLAQAKAHLRVVDSDDDTIIGVYIDAATKATEAFLGRALIDQTWDLYLDLFPTGTNLEIQIPKPPLIEVISIAYDQPNGTEATVDPGDYYIDTITEPGWVVPQGTLMWPTPIAAINSVRVRFRAGYLDNSSPPQAAVPEDIKSAVLLTIDDFFQERGDIVIGAIMTQIPRATEHLLRKHRVLLGMA